MPSINTIATNHPMKWLKMLELNLEVLEFLLQIGEARITVAHYASVELVTQQMPQPNRGYT